MTTPDLRCYGDAPAALEGLVPELDLRSGVEVTRWYDRAWDQIAGTLGFTRELAAARASHRSGMDPIAGARRIGILAFDRALEATSARASLICSSSWWMVCSRWARRSAIGANGR